MIFSVPTPDAKEIWRLKMAGERKAAAKSRPDAGIHAARIFLDNIPVRESSVVALYHPIKDELDTKPLASELLGRGYLIALPVVVKKQAPLIFREFRHGDPLEEGAYGVPVPTEAAAEVLPDIIVAPLLGFDRAGGRLGYGGGFYDRTLAALKAHHDIFACGVAYAGQEAASLPTDEHDHRLDGILTQAYFKAF